jgi:hypothetical protein
MIDFNQLSSIIVGLYTLSPLFSISSTPLCFYIIIVYYYGITKDENMPWMWSGTFDAWHYQSPTKMPSEGCEVPAGPRV